MILPTFEVQVISLDLESELSFIYLLFSARGHHFRGPNPGVAVRRFPKPLEGLET